MYVNTEGLVAHIDQKVRFTRGELIHEARRVEIFYANKKPVVLLTNNFDFTVEDIAQVEHSRHRSFDNFVANLPGGIAAYCYFPKKPSIRVQTVDISNDRQFTLF